MKLVEKLQKTAFYATWVCMILSLYWIEQNADGNMKTPIFKLIYRLKEVIS